MSEIIPQGWEDVALADVAECQLGKMLDKSKQRHGEPLPYLRNINVRWGHIDLNDLLKMPFLGNEIEKFSLRNGDVLVCEGGEPGRAAIWNHGETDLKFQKALHRVRPEVGVLPEWISCRLRYDAITGRLEGLLTGSTIKHLPGEALARYRFPLAPTAEQGRIMEKVRVLIARVTSARRELSKISGVGPEIVAATTLLGRLEQAILHKAFAGELVPQDPSDEPAAMLLTRIKSARAERQTSRRSRSKPQ